MDVIYAINKPRSGIKSLKLFGPASVGGFGCEYWEMLADTAGSVLYVELEHWDDVAREPDDPDLLARLQDLNLYQRDDHSPNAFVWDQKRGYGYILGDLSAALERLHSLQIAQDHELDKLEIAAQNFCLLQKRRKERAKQNKILPHTPLKAQYS